MADVLPFRRRSLKEKRQETARGKTLCGRGFHKWVIDQRKQFDVKQGKLVTIRRCRRCGASRTTAE